jgi:4-hydroxybenzoate polyprenyltransferase
LAAGIAVFQQRLFHAGIGAKQYGEGKVEPDESLVLSEDAASRQEGGEEAQPDERPEAPTALVPAQGNTPDATGWIVGYRAGEQGASYLTVLRPSVKVWHVIGSSDHPLAHQAAHRPIWVSFGELIRLRNQSGTWLLMLPSLWALVLANRGRPPLLLLLVFAAGSFLMRSLGVILNDLADRRFDRQVARTRERPLASGALTVPQALAAAALLLAAAAGLVLTLNTMAVALSPIALLLAALYPYAKRVLHIPQAMLGVAFGWGVIMAWAASRAHVEAPAWLLFAATVCWAIAYDTIYALQDRDDDARIGVKSAAVLFGRYTWGAVGICLTAMLGCLALAGYLCSELPVYYGVLTMVGVFFAFQLRKLRGPVPPQTAFALFKQHIWAGTAILFGMWAGLG